MLVRLAMASSRDPLVGLRLRRAARRLAERAHDRAPRQLDLEVVVAETGRPAQQRVGGASKILRRWTLALEHVFRFAVAPRLVGDAAERDPRVGDVAVLELDRGRDRDERE